MAQGRAKRFVHGTDIQRDQKHRGADQAEIQPQLLVPKNAQHISEKQKIITREVHAEEHHENARDGLHVGGIAGYAVISDAEAARSRRSECGTNRVKYRHIENEKQKAQSRQHNVHEIKNHRRVSHTRHKLSNVRSGGFRAKKMHREALVFAANGNQRHDKNKHPHAANPMAERAPIQRGTREPFNVCANGCPRRGEARNDLKKGIHVRRNIVPDKEGERAEQAHENPGKANANQALLGIKIALCIFAKPKQRAANQGTKQHGNTEAERHPHLRIRKRKYQGW